jgi:hypothetical protein
MRRLFFQEPQQLKMHFLTVLENFLSGQSGNIPDAIQSYRTPSESSLAVPCLMPEQAAA